jgi:hypothetical protein
VFSLSPNLLVLLSTTSSIKLLSTPSIHEPMMICQRYIFFTLSIIFNCFPFLSFFYVFITPLQLSLLSLFMYLSSMLQCYLVVFYFIFKIFYCSLVFYCFYFLFEAFLLYLGMDFLFFQCAFTLCCYINAFIVFSPKCCVYSK